MKKLFYLLLIPSVLITSCKSSEHFIKETSVRKEVKERFDERRKALSKKSDVFDNFSLKGISKSEREAMEFLYAYMPLSDLADYDFNFFLANVKSSFEARDFFQWGSKVPDNIFRHFVLPPRVNNENLDSARILFFGELKERIKNMSMYEAALEVNHWCHEKVTYRGSDNRTSAPLASMKTGFGRCGEESTFTVTALRAVGIPARQCYTPRWAHTDDNHAWVEVWCYGQWYYMGACEPEDVLNKAWFTAPAKRAMMVHTNVFGNYTGPEEKSKFPLFTKINVLKNYTATKRLIVNVTDTAGAPVADASVKYLLYNYSEFYPIYEKSTDEQGNSAITSGLGDLVVWAWKDGAYGYKQVSLASADSVNVTLDKIKGGEYTEDLDITPPAAGAVNLSGSNKGEIHNANRLKYEDSLRGAYLATFMTRAKAAEIAVKSGLDTASVCRFISKSEGNWNDISQFIEKNAGNENTLSLLATLSDKDLRDTPLQILQNHLDNTPLYDSASGYGRDVYNEGILAPGASYELIRDWRAVLKTKFADILKGSPSVSEIQEWVAKNVKIDPDGNYPRCPISPAGVSRILTSDKLSRDIFFVALCRTYGIPAKIDKATSVILVYTQGRWSPVSFEKKKPTINFGTLTLTVKGGKAAAPQYWTNFTIARYENGSFVALDFENDSRVAKFPATLSLEEGYYRICTGNRMTDGSVLVRNEYFNIQKDSAITKELIIRELPAKGVVYGTLSEELKPQLKNSKGMVICFIDPDKEPTKHIMTELPSLKSEFDKLGAEFVFVVPQSKISKGFSFESYKGLPAGSRLMPDNGEKILTGLTKDSKHPFSGNYPLIVTINPRNEIVFVSEGYKIGLAQFIYKSLL